MQPRKLFIVASCLIVLGLFMVSCAPAVAPTPKAVAETPAAKPAALSPTPKSAAEQPRYGGVLPISASVDPPSLDIHQETTTGALEPLVPAYDGLIQYDLHSGDIVRDLADRWEMNSDGLVYTFHLRKNATWHDGKPFSSADVRYSLERQQNPPKGMRAVRQEQFELVERIEAPDRDTVKIIMKQPSVAFIAQLATDWFVIMPKHILEAKGDMKKEVLGTGPFKLKSYSSGVSIELVKNPNYFMPRLPYLEGITHYIIKDSASRFAAFRTGRVKMTGHWASLTPSEAATTKAEYPHLAIWKYPALLGPSHPINAIRPPFSDVRVRRAVSLAYDRQTAIKVLAEGEAKLGTFLPPGQWGSPEQEILKLPGYRQPKDADRAEAKKLLADAGYPDGLKVRVLVRAVRLDQKAGEFMKDQLATIGINADIEVVETAVYTARTLSVDFQIGSQQNAWTINDPDELGRKFSTGVAKNYGKWSAKKFDDLFLQQARTLDPAKRKAMVKELDDLLLQEWPVIWPYWSDGILGTWPEVRNFASPPGLYSGMRLADIWLAK